MQSLKIMDDIDTYKDYGLLAEFFKQKLHLNMFVVCDQFNNLHSEPVPSDKDDIIGLEALAYYRELSKTILFSDFYIYNEVKNIILLKNDVLSIMILLLYTDDASKLEFIGVKNIRDLVEKYPVLLKSKV